jgi:hypothetical protein
MMMVMGITFAQYPTTKTIKGTPVVIMTVPQAEKIDIKFNKLNDTIVSLKKQLENLQRPATETTITVKEKEQKEDSVHIIRSILYNTMSTQMILMNARMDYLEKENKRIERIEITDRKARFRIGVGIGVVFAAWITVVLINLTN